MKTERLEYRYDPTHPAYVFLAAQAGQREVKLQKTINEAILEWWAWKQAGGPAPQLAQPLAGANVEDDDAPADELRQAAADFADDMM